MGHIEAFGFTRSPMTTSESEQLHFCVLFDINTLYKTKRDRWTLDRQKTYTSLCVLCG